MHEHLVHAERRSAREKPKRAGGWEGDRQREKEREGGRVRGR